MGQISIYLTGRDGFEKTSDCRAEYSENGYSKNFKKVTINITYLKSNNKVTFKFRKRIDTVVFYRYYTSYDNQVLEKIEVYTSKFHPKNPLVVGFQIKGNQSFRYFTYSEIKKYTYTYGVPSTGEFGQDQLDVKLNDENKHRNKIIFSIQYGQRQNYHDEIDNKLIDGYVRYMCIAKDDDKYVDHKMSKDKLFEKERLEDPSTIDNLLEHLDGKPFDSIRVYYSTNPTIILLIEFIDQSTKTHFVRKDEKGVYWIKEEVNYIGNENLKLELNKIKLSLGNISFFLDKNSNDDKFKNKINVTNEPQPSHGFTKYIHTPINTQNASVFYKDIQFPITENNRIHDKLEVQDKSYKKIETYSLTTRPYLHLLIKFTLLKDSKEYHFQRFNKEGTQWKQIENNGNLSGNQHIKNKLREIDYPFQKSLILKINEKGRYNSGTISNSSESLNPPNTFVIVPNASSSCGTYNSYNHSLATSKSTFKNDVVGIRLKCYDKEIKLYKGDAREGNKEYMYYDQTKNDFYVYFYGQDDRPLMLCYNNKVYRPPSKEDFNQCIFSLVQGISCPCRRNDVTFTNKLKDINDQLNEVDISKDREYIVHTYNKLDKKINVRTSTVGCYTRYTHTPASGNGLGTIKYKNDYIKEDNGENLIKASGNNQVLVYYNSKDRSRKNPLIVALCTSTNCNNTNLYYELQKSESSQKKIYKKISQPIILDTSPDGPLHTKLDGIFHSLTKSLCIVLDIRLNDYQSSITSNIEPSQQGSTQITVEQFSCSKLNHTGYKCYIHKITSLSEIGDIGGLKFSISDNPFKPIKLFSHDNTQIQNVIYNSCKGNVYVFFYNSDPRPLLLCFDYRGYKPRGLSKYENEWVVVEGINTCDFSRTDFDAATILQTLYVISMEINPVNLELTKEAYKGQDVKDGHTYTIHNYGPKPIKVKITSEKLVCYKKYVHEPESGSNTGYRLGKINYDGLTDYGLSYPEQRPLQRVLLYYSVYDTEHKHPLLVQLCFKGSSTRDTEYHKLDDKNSLKWEKLYTDKHRYLLEKLSKDDTLESGLYDIRTGMNIYYDEDQKKNHFFNPEQCKEDDVSLAAVVGGSVGGGVAGIGSFVGIGFLVFKKAVAAFA